MEEEEASLKVLQAAVAPDALGTWILHQSFGCFLDPLFDVDLVYQSNGSSCFVVGDSA